MKLKFISILVFLISVVSYCQAGKEKTSTVSGFVYDKSTGESLIGANVIISGKGNLTGASTNNNGYFIILNAPLGTDTIKVSYVGYEPSKLVITVSSKNSGLLKFYLIESSVKLGEVIVSSNSVSKAQKEFDAPVSSLSLTPQQISSMPKLGEPDLLRALQSMPGITSISDFSSAIYVRGGTPDQNLYLIDGAEIYDPEHAFGIFSTFNTDAIKKVDVLKGGFGPQYDDRLSAVIDVIDKEGNRNNFQGILDLSLIAANLTVQVPLGSLGSISGSIRRTYINQTVGRFISKIPPYYFFDGNLKTFLQLTDKDIFTLSFFNSGDNLNFQTEEGNPQSPSILLDWGNTVGSANWKHLFNDKLFSSLYLTYSGFFSDYTNTNASASSSETNPLRDYTAREALTYYTSENLTIEAGAEYKDININYNRNFNSALIDLSEDSHEIAAYSNFEWKPTPLWQIDAGLRFQQFQSDTTYTHLDPRLSVKYRLSENSSLKFATGIYHQYLEAVERPFAPNIWLLADKYNYDSQSDHFILGYNQQISDLFNLDVETYYKTYKNINIFNYNTNAEVSPTFYNADGLPVYSSSQDVFTRGNGHSDGIEFILRRDAGVINGWIGYSLSGTKETFAGVNQGQPFVPQQERTSIVNLVLNGDLNSIFSGNWNGTPTKSSSRWVLGLNFVYSSGQPITLPSSAYFVNTLPAWDNYNATGQKLPSYQLYPGSIDSYRLPPYFRLDLCLTWHLDFGSWSMSPYFQIFNVTDRKNVWYLNYSSEEQGDAIVQTINRVNQIPFLPSIGTTIKF